MTTARGIPLIRRQHSDGFPGVRSIIGVFNNISIQVKASAASVSATDLSARLGNKRIFDVNSVHRRTACSYQRTRTEAAGSLRVRDAVFATHEDIPLRVMGKQWRQRQAARAAVGRESIGDLNSLSNRITALAQREDFAGNARRCRSSWPSGRPAKITPRIGWRGSEQFFDGRSDGDDDAWRNGQQLEAVDTELQNLSLAITEQCKRSKQPTLFRRRMK